MLLLPTIGGIILLVKCSQGSNFMPSIYEVSGPVLFGMYLVPVILSITLFSFIYKRGVLLILHFQCLLIRNKYFLLIHLVE